jgi:hypothetical protein
MLLTHPATPEWWDWSSRWAGDGGSHITLAMTLFDADPPFFGGFGVDADCVPSQLFDLWMALRRDLPRLWLHLAARQECNTPQNSSGMNSISS